MEYRNVTDRRTDRQSDRIAISISRVSMLTRDKNQTAPKHSCPAKTSYTNRYYSTSLPYIERRMEKSTSRYLKPPARRHNTSQLI